MSNEPLTTPSKAPTETNVPARLRSAKQTLWMALLAYFLFSLIVPLVPIRTHHLPIIVGLVLIVVPTMIFMLLQLWLARAIVEIRPKPKVCIIGALGCIALWFASLFLVHPFRGLPDPINLALFYLRPIMLGMTITLTFAFVGTVLSLIVREPNVLLPIALISMPIDYLGAMTPIGFTQNVMQQHPNAIKHFLIPVPVVNHGTVGGLHLFPMIGPGDALFIAFFLALVLRLRMNERGTFWWMYGLLTAAMLMVIIMPNFNIAALVPMGLAVIIANVRFFRFTRAEVFATLYAIVLVLALVVAFYLYSHSHFFRHH